MQQHIKQRLVGVAVIFSLAVIFLPMLLDGSAKHPRNLDINIPPSPAVTSNVRVEEKIIELKDLVNELPELEAVIVDEISDPPDMASVTDLTNNKTSNEASAQAIAPDPQPVKTKTIARPSTSIPEVDAKPKVGGASWVIQAGSFNDKHKAYKQRDRLRKSNLAAVFIEKFKHQGALRYRVRIGPFIKRNKADVVRNKILAKYNIKGLIMRYEK